MKIEPVTVEIESLSATITDNESAEQLLEFMYVLGMRLTFSARRADQDLSQVLLRVSRPGWYP